MTLDELLVGLSQKGFKFGIWKNNGGLTYETTAQGRTKFYTEQSVRFSIVTNADKSPFNIYWDNPVGTMRFKTYQDAYDYLVEGKATGEWTPSNASLD